MFASIAGIRDNERFAAHTDYNPLAMERQRNSVRDAIHGFIPFGSKEKALVGTRAFQRLRSVRQLASAPWVYPGANHTRLEHSLGVMHLAGLLFEQLEEDLRGEIGFRREDLDFMRPLLRAAALLHDLGHPPFSHAFEGLRPTGAGSHEEITLKLLRSPEVESVLNDAPSSLLSKHVAAVCLKPEERHRLLAAKDILDSRYIVLGELISGDLLGADRMDYLLRDSHHAGVAYGRFDLARVLDTVRLVRDQSGDPAFAIEEGGVEAAEGMLIARYSMFAQVYLHHVRRLYDEMLRRAVADTHTAAEIEEMTDDGFVEWTEDEVMSRLRSACSSRKSKPIWNCLFSRQHPRVAFAMTGPDLKDLPKRATEIRGDIVKSLESRGFGQDRTWVDATDADSISVSAKDLPVVEHGSTKIVGRFGQRSAVAALLPRISFIRVYAFNRGEEELVRAEATRAFDEALESARS